MLYRPCVSIIAPVFNPFSPPFFCTHSDSLNLQNQYYCEGCKARNDAVKVRVERTVKAGIEASAAVYLNTVAYVADRVYVCSVISWFISALGDQPCPVP